MIGKLYKMNHVGTFHQCANCQLTYFEGTTGKWPWRIFSITR